MAGEAKGGHKADGVDKIRLFTDAGQFNPSVIGGGASRAVPEGIIEQTVNATPFVAASPAKVAALVNPAEALRKLNQTNPGVPVAPAGTAAWRSGGGTGVGPPAGAH